MKNKTELIRQTTEVLFATGQVIEVRALGNNSTYSGYFNDFNELIRRVEILDSSSDVNGIYIVLNEINPSLLARRANRIPKLGKKDNTTSDSDIIRRRWLPIDIDPKRPSGISSSDEEHKRALLKAEGISNWLSKQGFPEPILADSGNGAHLLYRIDIENTDENRYIVETFLEVLSIFHSDEYCAIDTSVFNAARIWKLYGTMSRKGDNIPERPHRRAKILSVPNTIKVVPKTIISNIGSIIPETVFLEKNNYNHLQHQQHLAQRNIPNLKEWLEENHIDFADEKKWKDGTLYVLEQCPFSDAHKYGAYAIQFSNGGIHIACHHDSCGGNRNRWKELRDRYENKTSPSKVLSTKSILCSKNNFSEIIEISNFNIELFAEKLFPPEWLEKQISMIIVKNKGLSETSQSILEMITNGDSIKDIAQAKKIKTSTVTEHLLTIVLLGYNIPLSSIQKEVAPDIWKQVFLAIQKHGLASRTRIKESLNNKVDYFEITIVIIWLISFSNIKERYSSNKKLCDDSSKSTGIFVPASVPVESQCGLDSIKEGIIKCIGLLKKSTPLGKPFGKKYIFDLLKGTNSDKISSNKHDNLVTFGLLKEYDVQILEKSLAELIESGYLRNSGGLMPRICLEQKAKNYLEMNNILTLQQKYAPQTKHETPNIKTEMTAINNEFIERSILACVNLFHAPFGKYHLRDVLQGREIKKVKEYEHDKFSVYGALKDVSDDTIFSSIETLMNCGYLKYSGGYRPTIRITTAGKLRLEQNDFISTKKF